MSRRPAESPLVVVVGDAALDYTIDVGQGPHPDEKVPVLSSTRGLGGTGANAAAQVVKLGGSCSLVSAIGDDSSGDWILAELDRVGIIRDHVVRHSGASTMCTIVRAGADSFDGSDRRVYVDLGVGADISLGDAGTLRTAERIYVSYAPQIIVPLLELGLGARVIVGLEHWMVDESLVSPLEQVGLIVTNAAGLSALTQLEADLDVPIVVTNGSSDVEIRRRRTTVETVPAMRIDVVDATGAGDSFAGALCFAIAGGASIRDAVRLAVVVAGMSTAHVGAQAGQPIAAAARERAGVNLLPD